MLGVMFSKTQRVVNRKSVCLGCQYVDGPPQEGGVISQCAGGKVRMDWEPGTKVYSEPVGGSTQSISLNPRRGLSFFWPPSKAPSCMGM